MFTNDMLMLRWMNGVIRVNEMGNLYIRNSRYRSGFNSTQKKERTNYDDSDVF